MRPTALQEPPRTGSPSAQNPQELPQQGPPLPVSVDSDTVEEQLPPRELGRIVGERPGPVLVVVAALHGNEPSGVEGLKILFREFADVCLDRGTVIGLVGNRKALAQDVRYIHEDLNRIWTRERVEAVRSKACALEAEDFEIAGLDRALREARQCGVGTPYVLDLHSTSGPGRAFTTLDDSLVNRDFALAFPVPLVVGLEEQLAGTLLNYLTREGWVNAGFESGQHTDPDSVTRARAAIWIAMEAAGLVSRERRPEIQAAYKALRSEHRGMPKVVEVRYRHHIRANDNYKTYPGFRSFQPIAAGDRIGSDTSGPVESPQSGLLLMPLYQTQGEDGFFVTRPVKLFWLRLSARLRPLRLDRFMRWLPGVSLHPEVPRTLVVNRRYARWRALEIFHLLGFRRVGTEGEKLILERR